MVKATGAMQMITVSCCEIPWVYCTMVILYVCLIFRLNFGLGDFSLLGAAYSYIEIY